MAGKGSEEQDDSGWFLMKIRIGVGVCGCSSGFGGDHWGYQTRLNGVCSPYDFCNVMEDSLVICKLVLS